MARAFLTALIIVILNVLVGCQDVNREQSRLLPSRSQHPPASERMAVVPGAVEADIVEQVATNRRAYRQSLDSLIDYYSRIGNNMKLQWAKKESAALDLMPQYRYIVYAEVAGADLEASRYIPEADDLYAKAVKIYKSRDLLVFANNDRMRIALDKFNQLIQKYPTSDKIDDAAFRAGEIYRYFKDYSIAILYYRRAYQWDKDTVYPAYYRAAFVLDRFLHQKDEALKLYQKCVERQIKDNPYKALAARRILELTRQKSPPAKAEQE